MSSELRPTQPGLNKFSKLTKRPEYLTRVLTSVPTGLLGLPLLIFTFVTLISGTGCTKKSSDSEVAAAGSAKAEVKATTEVNLAIWANYLSPEMQEKFTKETGIQIHISNYSSSEELLAKAQAGASGIDVAVPSDYMVGVMAKTGLLLPLESAKIPNKAGLDPELLKREYDPENLYSLPYSWNVTGIAINHDLFKGSIKSWKDLFANQELAGKLSLLDDAREVTAMALRVNGFSVNTVKPEELAKAETSLKEVRSRVKMFTSDVIDPLVKKEVVVAQGYSSDVLQAARNSGGKIDFVLPEDGGTRSIDNLVILKGAKNIVAAHALINFLLSPEVNAAFVKQIMGGPVVLKTKSLVSPELQKNTILFPPKNSLSKFEFLHDVGEATRLYDRLWTEVRAQ